MNILVLMKMVPDIVEELELDAGGKSLRLESLRLIVSERDEHALEQALLLKERAGGSVTVVAPDSPDVDDVLFTALARGADRAVKVCCGESPLTTSQAASLLAGVIATAPGLMPADLILTGCQAIDDLDGMVGPTIAEALEVPYLGIVTGVREGPDGGQATVLKEYAGGVRGEYLICLPAVLGVQAAEKPPRYVPVAKVRATMKSGKIDVMRPSGDAPAPALRIVRMTKPEAAGHAEMLEGSPEEIASRVADILSARGLL